ncbi:hypothetical protein DVH05_010429 [Phytophthora capsici]|nr:hypothetical protein DVH05_010429 [Phytophthora capsici]
MISEAEKENVAALHLRNQSSLGEDSRNHNDDIAVSGVQTMAPASLNTPGICWLPPQLVFGQGVWSASPTAGDDQDNLPIRNQEKLTEMVEQQKAQHATKTLNAAKRKRDDKLREAGLRHRENVARAVFGEELAGLEASSDESYGASITKRQRRYSRLERFLEDDREEEAKLQKRRLDLEQNRFKADLEMRKEEMALRRQELELRHMEIQNANQQKQLEMEMRQQEFQAESSRKQYQFYKEIEFKLKKLELLLKCSGSRNTRNTRNTNREAGASWQTKALLEVCLVSKSE